MGSNTSGSPGDDTRTVLDAVRAIVHALRASSRWAEKHVGVSGAQLFVLQRIAETPRLSVNDLAARTHTHQSSVSTVVSRLVAQGLVRRRRSAVDRRSVELSLTARGQRVVERSPDLAHERLIGGVEGLSAARRRQLASVLSELARAMDAVDQTPRMFFEEQPARRSRTADA
jgi:DNA-binding MarR family transcriptional regulator